MTVKGDLSISPPREIIFKQKIERNSAKMWQFKRCLTGPNVFSNNSINDLILSHSRYLLDMARQNVFHSCLLTQLFPSQCVLLLSFFYSFSFMFVLSKANVPVYVDNI